MNFQDIKAIVSVGAHIKIKSSQFRFSELHSLIQTASTLERGIITITVESGTLNNSEILSLARLGGKYIQFDLTLA